MLDKTPPRQAVNVSIRKELIAQARELDINISRAADNGVAEAIRQRKAQLWLQQYAEAIELNNRHFEEHGLPFAEYRGF